ncbi:MAG: hypothetical protein GMKNLPBB_01754 [Myxococcota bacterium]|nr:hypothetical protein [Myxococcota bacterium]
MPNLTRIAVLLSAGVFLFAGCSAKLIPNTQIKDTPDSREIVTQVERYRLAMQDRNAESLLRLVSRNYFDNAGTPDPSDDYNYAGLVQFLANEFRDVEALQMDIVILALNFEEGDKGVAHLDYKYESRFQVKYPSGSKWDSVQKKKRMKFVREGDHWLISSGL